jgi:dethiobiotin synthetase
MKNSVFITGTDTDAGKTYVSVLLLQLLNDTGLITVGLKPISAGCELVEVSPGNEQLRNADALALQSAASLKLEYDVINPIAFAPPIAPHIAAKEADVKITTQALTAHYQSVQEGNQADFTLVEGAGGWRLPLSVEQNEQVFLSDFVVAQQLPTILVVGMKLGCLNHALLTYEQLMRDGAKIVGWIANSIDSDMIYYQENLATLQACIDAPLLSEVANGASAFSKPEALIRLFK